METTKEDKPAEVPFEIAKKTNTSLLKVLSEIQELKHKDLVEIFDFICK